MMTSLRTTFLAVASKNPSLLYDVLLIERTTDFVRIHEVKYFSVDDPQRVGSGDEDDSVAARVSLVAGSGRVFSELTARVSMDCGSDRVFGVWWNLFSESVPYVSVWLL
ncbi:hypothetical protein C5167_042369 [Papaver somniferum]|uniref:Uncharacterized protein n=1 Tax=Papaver somniferum TaxID=3469 RepID=A0A4Y7L585_PAPSO|nr:hypothetical protein C5167_042369 [Papaver somniferum]